MTWIAVFLLSSLVAFVELASRYKEEPSEIAKVLSAYFYCGLNGLFGVSAYWIVQNVGTGWTGIQGTEPGKVLIASFSAMAFFRLSFFNVKIGGKTVDVGIATIAQLLLSMVDRRFDQARSVGQLERVRKTMLGLEFERASAELPLICLALMQHVTKEEETELGKQVALIRKQAIRNEQKVLMLGIVLSRVTGISLLDSAAKGLREIPPSTSAADEKRASLEQLLTMLASQPNSESKMPSHE